MDRLAKILPSLLGWVKKPKTVRCVCRGMRPRHATAMNAAWPPVRRSSKTGLISLNRSASRPRFGAISTKVDAAQFTIQELHHRRRMSDLGCDKRARNTVVGVSDRPAYWRWAWIYRGVIKSHVRCRWRLGPRVSRARWHTPHKPLRRNELGTVFVRGAMPNDLEKVERQSFIHLWRRHAG